ncbi:MAG: hypothetical protein O7E56_12705 [SAR324 cluster bacterium]|nr:hypothetical protein [SAR324 cluster bacterium]
MNSHRKSWTALLLPAMFLWMAIPSAVQAQFPEGKGNEIVEMVCGQCHGLNNISDARRTMEEWESVVSDMVARGAPLLIDEIDTVTEYLAENFGPQSPPPATSQQEASASAATTLSEGQGKELVETVCAQCHGLNIIFSAGYSSKEEWVNVVSDMIARGAPLLDDEMDIVAGYLAANFSPEASSSSSAGTSSQAAANLSASTTLPAGKGKEIVEIACGQCHGLNNISDARRTMEEWESVVSDMVARGAPLLIDEIDTVANYLTEHFGP